MAPLFVFRNERAVCSMLINKAALTFADDHSQICLIDIFRFWTIRILGKSKTRKRPLSDKIFIYKVVFFLFHTLQNEWECYLISIYLLDIDIIDNLRREVFLLIMLSYCSDDETSVSILIAFAQGNVSIVKALKLVDMLSMIKAQSDGFSELQ